MTANTTIHVGGDNRGDIAGRDINKTIVYEGDQAYDVRGLVNPYLGLQAFTYAERSRYAGRQAEITHAVNFLTNPGSERSLLFVTGASGSGKSSFAQAGLLPALETHYQQQDFLVKWAVFRPGAKPLAGFAGALRTLSLAAAGVFAPAAEHQLIPLASPAAPNQISLLIIDQFEELFSQSEEAQQEIFFDILTNLPPFRQNFLHIIATMRADYLPDLFAHKTLYDIAKAGVDLRAMGEEDLKLAIQCPLQAVYPDEGKRFQSALLNRLAQEAAEDAAYLPLLQVTLDDLWRVGILTSDHYISLTDAIRKRADEIYLYKQGLDGRYVARNQIEQETIRNIFLDLVDVSLEDDIRRDVRRTRRLADVTRGRPDAEALIQELASARLLATDEKEMEGDSADVESVDIIHESLINNWPRLREVIGAQREQLQQRRRFELYLSSWLKNARSATYLLNGVYLAEAEKLKLVDDIALRSPEAKTFLQESIGQRDQMQAKEIERQKELAEAQRQRAESERAAADKLRLRAFLLSAALLIALVAVAVSILAYRNQRRQTILAQAGQSATEVQVLLRRDIPPHEQILETAIHAIDLLVENHMAIPLPVEQSLRDAIVDTRLLGTYQNPSNVAYQALSLSPDGALLVTGNSDNTVHLYPVDREGIQPPRILRGHTNTIQDLSSVRNGLVASIGDEAIVWDVHEGRVLLQTETRPFREFAIEIDPAGKLLAIGGAGTIRLYDLDKPEALPQRWLKIEANNEMIQDLQFDALGHYLISGGNDGVVRIWNLVDASVIWESEILTREVSSVAITSDNTMVAATVYDQLFVWRQIQEPGGGHLRFGTRSKVGGHQEYIRQTRFSPNGRCIVTAGDDGVIRLWDSTTLTLRYTLDGHTARIGGAAFNPYAEPQQTRRFTECGKRLYSVGWDKTIRQWNVSAPTEVATFTDFTQPVEALDISEDAHLATADQDGAVTIWDLQTFTKRQAWRHSYERLGDVKFTPDGQALATAGYDKRIIFWHWRVNAPWNHFEELLGHRDPVLGISFRADGTQLVSAGRDLKVRIWDTTTHEIIHEQTTSDYALDAALSPTKQNLLAVATFLDARLLNLENGNYWILDKHETRDVEFIENPEFLITAGMGGLNLWDVSDSDNLSKAKSIQLSINANSLPVLAVAVAEKDDLLVAGTNDGKIIAWTISDIIHSLNLAGRLIYQLGLGINDVAIDSSSGHIVVAGEDGTVRVLTLNVEELLQIAEKRRQNYQ